jgi:hypothetical protein
VNAREKVKEDQKTARRLIKEMNGESLKKDMNAKAIEEWINLTLAEAEELKGIPESAVKRDARHAITRYGIARFTLLKAGIPNDDVTQLYKSLFAHTQGMLQQMKSTVDKVKEVSLGIDPESGTVSKDAKHLKKSSILSALWKVYQMLLEYAHYTDYQLLITRTTNDLRERNAFLEQELAEIEIAAKAKEE